jgi:hypothetical protein
MIPSPRNENQGSQSLVPDLWFAILFLKVVTCTQASIPAPVHQGKKSNVSWIKLWKTIPATSYKEPTKESQDTKPRVVKSGYDGHIPLIYLVLLTEKRTHAESLEACASVYHGAHRCALGAHGSEGARTPAPSWGGATTLAPREGAHACALSRDAHACSPWWCSQWHVWNDYLTLSNRIEF